MSVEIWSDVVCPWCYIGKRRWEKAVEQLAGEVEFEVVYRAYQLDPSAAPGEAMPARDGYARKFGGYEQAEHHDAPKAARLGRFAECRIVERAQ